MVRGLVQQKDVGGAGGEDRQGHTSFPKRLTEVCRVLYLHSSHFRRLVEEEGQYPELLTVLVPPPLDIVSGTEPLGRCAPGCSSLVVASGSRERAE